MISFPRVAAQTARPSATDFILHDMPNVIDRLADAFFGATMSIGYDDPAPELGPAGY